MGQITKTFAHAKMSMKCLPILDKKVLGELFRIVDISKHRHPVIRLLIEDYICFRPIYVKPYHSMHPNPTNAIIKWTISWAANTVLLHCML